MSLDTVQTDSPPITSPEQCVDWFRAGERPSGTHLVGLEHEKFLYPKGGTTPVPYEGPRGIGELLKRIAAHGCEAVHDFEGGPIIALRRGMATISLEPGGQFELSGSPFRTARQAHHENLMHLAELQEAADGLQLEVLPVGYRPFGRHQDMPWMPKSRYVAMRESLPQRGARALDMMQMTSTGQVNLDWADEADCARKVTLTARLSPLLLALYANSPLQEGRPAGLMSVRSRVWDSVDSTRCGYLPSMVDGTFSYRAYVDWALAAPILFLRRNGRYLRPQVTFGQLLANGFEGAPVTESDWADHLSTLFPEVRIKRVMEVRSADSCSPAMTGALPALWRGLLYEPLAMAEAEQLLPRLSFEAHLALHREAQERGLGGQLGQATLGELALQMVEIAHRGLLRLDPEDAPLLEPLLEVAAEGRSPAQDILDAYAQDSRPEALLARLALPSSR
jgi:glutamate--cysteine ligase